MSLYFVIAILSLMLVLSIIFYKDIMSPAVIMLVPWLIAFGLLRFSDFYYQHKSPTFSYMLGGIILFQICFGIGYLIVNQRRFKSKILKKSPSYDNLLIDFKKLVITSVIETMLLMYYQFKLIRGSNPILLFEYVHQITIALFALCLIIYFCQPNRKTRNRQALFIQGVPFVIGLTLNTNGRAAYFQVGFLLLFSYLTFHKYNNKLIFKRLVQMLFVFFGLFVYVAIRKHHIQSGLGLSSTLDEATKWIIHYMSGSIVSFQLWFPQHQQFYVFGENTFRIIYAIGNRFLDSNIPVSSTYFPFVQIGPDPAADISNVYTMYYTYIVDFGVVFGIMFQGILGFVYAYVYLLKDRKSVGAVLLFSLLVYPLIMQIFGDQYVALESGYLQYFVVYLVFHKFGLLYRRRTALVASMEE